jgi:hypothetical protein
VSRATFNRARRSTAASLAKRRALEQYSPSLKTTENKIMQFRTSALALALLLGSTVAQADLEPFKDYDTSEAVWSVTTIKVASNMGDAYLEGIAKTWVSTNEIAKKLGQIEEYHIYRSDLPESGDFNLLLVIKFKNAESATQPNKAQYDAFMKEIGKEKSDEVTQYSQKNYPAMREITGEYMVREITLKK